EGVGENKIKDINKNTSLRKGEKDAGIGEVNKLKEEGIENMNKGRNEEEVDDGKESGEEEI
ncbi:DUF1542 domain-containing protein, partial [Staphylococcus warneri]|uniref:DUF1542 domain-containing protein n=1 Tax=Staphylococcus warneri TaxID=1292 RepID=UPI0011A113B3